MTMEERLQEIVDALGEEAGILQLLDPGERRELAVHFKLRHLPAGTVFLTGNEKVDFIGIIASGELRFEHENEITGRPLVLAMLGKGSHIGDVPMAGEREALGQLTAVEDTELLVVSHDDLEVFMNEHPRTAVKIVKGINAVLTRRLRFAIDMVVKRS